MKLIFVRHADPDYEKDSLTEKGWREAKLLAARMKNIKADYCYLSPLGRARDTASFSLKEMNMEATVLPWLQEFPIKVNRPDSIDRGRMAWDWLPEDWTVYDDFYDWKKWTSHPAFVKAGVGDEAAYVLKEFDSLLENHGYVKDNKLFRVTEANDKTLVFFCHFGIECLLLSYLLSISPMILWHGMCAAPTSVTTVWTEERRAGKASFRIASFGDISHLYIADEPPAFSARFCEMYDNIDERHD